MQQKSQKTPFHCYKNNNYCWTHGHHVEDNHTLLTCTMSAPGHQLAAMTNNTVGGKNAVVHKTIMSLQRGCTHQMVKQFSPIQAYNMWDATGFPAGGPKQFYTQMKAQRNEQNHMQTNGPRWYHPNWPIQCPCKTQQFQTPKWTWYQWEPSSDLGWAPTRDGDN